MVCEKWVLLICAAAVSFTAAQEDEFEGSHMGKYNDGDGGEDQNSAETGFGGFGGGGGGIDNSKYFHYQHLPEHDKYEFGYRRGNDHHVRERHEKAVPHDGHFKTKVRWADHKGGHGEHYWDYNHAGHHDDDGDGEGSDPAPIYTAPQSTHPRFLSPDDESSHRREYAEDPDPEAEGFMKSIQQQIGDIEGLEIAKENEKIVKPLEQREYVKRVAKSSAKNGPQYVFDLETGRVVDEATGRTYLLQAVEN